VCCTIVTAASVGASAAGKAEIIAATSVSGSCWPTLRVGIARRLCSKLRHKPTVVNVPAEKWGRPTVIGVAVSGEVLTQSVRRVPLQNLESRLLVPAKADIVYTARTKQQLKIDLALRYSSLLNFRHIKSRLVDKEDQ
jgi:hypothetical protein